MSFIDRAAELLFPENGRQTLNVKFFCAGDTAVTAEELAEQVIRAHVQIHGGTARLVNDVDSHLTPAV